MQDLQSLVSKGRDKKDSDGSVYVGKKLTAEQLVILQAAISSTATQGTQLFYDMLRYIDAHK